MTEDLLNVSKRLIEDRDKTWPGFRAKVAQAAQSETDTEFVIGRENLTLIFRDFYKPTIKAALKPNEPSLAALTRNFAWATARWVKKGMPVVTKEIYQIRAQICDACPHWDGKARGGLGKCNAPGCGCTSFKRWLATEKCPLGKWPAVS